MAILPQGLGPWTACLCRLSIHRSLDIMHKAKPRHVAGVSCRSLVIVFVLVIIRIGKIEETVGVREILGRLVVILGFGREGLKTGRSA